MWSIRSLHSPRNRGEHLIASWRAVLASASLLAIWLDPSEPSKHANVAYALLIAYLGYALLLLPLTWGSLSPRRLGLVTHVADLATFTLLLYFTEGATSPFFVYYVFSLFCAAVRWQRRGIFWTTLAVLLLYGGMGIVMDLLLHDPHFELNRYIIRSVYLAVVGLMLAYLTAYEQRTRENLARLAAWPEENRLPLDSRSLVQETLRYGSAIMQTPTALLVWDEAEEPFRRLAHVAPGVFEWLDAPPDCYEPLVAGPLAELDFICSDAAQAPCTVLCGPAASLMRLPVAPLHPGMQARFGLYQVLSLRVRGEHFSGRLFFAGKKDMSDDDLQLGELVASMTEAAMNRLFRQQSLQLAASAEERIRLARDLHDGLLQSLTGIALQMESLRKQDAGAAGLRQRLAEIQELIAEEQRGLRAFIQQLKPAAPAPTIGRQLDLRDLSAGIERRWGIQVQLTVQPGVADMPASLEYDVRHLLHEALVNSAKHGHPSLIRAEVGLRDGQVWLCVTDDGVGFPFRGRYSLEQLVEMQAGPKSLQERVLAMGGDLLIVSAASGSTLEILLPWPGSAAATGLDSATMSSQTL